MRLVAAVAAALLTVGCTAPAAEAPAPVSAQSEAPIAEPLRARLQARLDTHRTDHGYPGAIAGVWSPEGTWIGKTGLAGRDSDRSRGTWSSRYHPREFVSLPGVRCCPHGGRT